MAKNKIGWKFDNTYKHLPNSMLTKINPTPVKNPETIIFNYNLAKKIDLDFTNVDDEEIALIFSGNKLPEGSETISQAYAGHQFGHFTILGDGRAHIIGEHITKNKKRFDIQFKGSGKTPYSRNADGRAALGPMLREYLISEAMNSLGVSTTRSLAVIKTGEKIIRETDLNGAVLTRVASSHIRVGTFQFALISENKDNLKNLFNYVVERHYPKIKDTKKPAIALLEIVLDKQIELICDWMRIGFIHGVMNTDNMTISGETIDYGPCAFMDRYDPATVFSSIDLHGRYSYYNQPRITKWNLERFAECLLPLINSNKKIAVDEATEVLSEFPKKYKEKWMNMMKKKLGLIGEDHDDESLIIELLTWMHKNKADYTNTFCYLTQKLKINDEIYKNQSFYEWEKKWFARNKQNNNYLKNMDKHNPTIIPRNHLVENALTEAVEKNKITKIINLLKIIENPHKAGSEISYYQSTPVNEPKYTTYCGT